jgi:ketose-bisphosphate aldolase
MKGPFTLSHETIPASLDALASLSLKDIMARAYQRHVVVPAFNVAYLPMLKPIADTLKAERSFGLVEVARPDIEMFGAQSYQAVAAEFTGQVDRRFVRLHQDHVPVIDQDQQRVDWRPLIDEALQLRFDSVMVDGSRLGLEENIAVTREVAEMAHPGTAVEAELGAVLGHEAGPLPPYEELFASGRGFTDVAEAVRFVRETGVDWLSVAIGNIHGAISGAAKDAKKVTARLNIDHLYTISEAVGIPLVLHGGSGIDLACVLQAVENGITKINVGTALRQAYETALRERDDIAYAQAAVARATRAHLEDYRILGSAERLA